MQRRRPAKRPPAKKRTAPKSNNLPTLIVCILLALAIGAFAVSEVRARYTISFQSPFRLQLQSPIVIEHKSAAESAIQAQADQGRPLTAYQQYACKKFGSACRVALAIQRAENPQGRCEIYHYNSNGTLDWGYFQINTVHLTRAGLNLRDLLDCKANIDFAYQLYAEQQGFTAWSTFNSGAYRRFLSD